MLTILKHNGVNLEQIYETLENHWRAYINETGFSSSPWDITLLMDTITIYSTTVGSSVFEITTKGREVNIEIKKRGKDVEVIDHLSKFFGMYFN